MRVVDFHTHAFPDALAERAIGKLADGSHDYPPQHDGTVKGLLGSMDEGGIDTSVICSIATKPSQERPILDWSKEIASDRIVPFISLHPEGEGHEEKLKEAVDAGIKGVKFHCMYQGFKADEERVFDLYELLTRHEMLVLFHAGRDIRWPASDIASPQRMLNVHKAFPEMKIVTAHFGGWLLWKEVADLLAGTGLVMDTSFSLGHIESADWEEIWDRHSHDRIVFGSDSPWASQKVALEMFRADCPSPEDYEKAISVNPCKLLGLKND